MKKRDIIRIMSFSLSIAIASAIFCFKTKSQNERYILEIENNYSYMYDELGTAVNNISDTLNKARFVTTPAQVSSMASKLLTEAEISKNSLAQLPVREELSSLNKFLSQVGNFAFCVSENMAKGEKMTREESDNIEILNDTARKVAEIVNDSRVSYNNLEYWASEIEPKLEEAVDNKTLETSLKELEDELKDYPTLIYDGPYSDHILEKAPALLEGVSPIDQNEAKNIAAKWSQSYLSDLDFAGVSDGHIKTFDFLGTGVSISVTQKGGYVLFMRKEREIEDIKLDNNKAREKAEEYLLKMGMTQMSETYYYESNGICTINYAFLDGKTLCYTDFVKVGVAMDTGEIVLYEAGGYISNHKDRAFKVAKYSEKKASKIISDKLEIKKVQLALIPTDSEGEERCYEFACISNDGQEVLVYINTATLAEEDILILCKSDGGTLVK